MLGYKKSSFYLLRPIFCDIFVCKNAWKTRKYHRETLEVRSAIMPARVQYLGDVRMMDVVLSGASMCGNVCQQDGANLKVS